jgi:hypothetical protein
MLESEGRIATLQQYRHQVTVDRNRFSRLPLPTR